MQAPTPTPKHAGRAGAATRARRGARAWKALVLLATCAHLLAAAAAQQAACKAGTQAAAVGASSYTVKEASRSVGAGGAVTYCFDVSPTGAACGAGACCPKSGGAGGPGASRLLVPLDLSCLNVPDNIAGYKQALAAVKGSTYTISPGGASGRVGVKINIQALTVALVVPLTRLSKTGASSLCIVVPVSIVKLGCASLWAICGDAPCPFAIETKPFVNAAGAKVTCCLQGSAAFQAEMPSCAEQTAKHNTPCKNGGTCVDNPPGAGGYTCKCPLGWVGPTCADPTAENKCVHLTNPCNETTHAGVCINDPTLPAGYACNCQQGLMTPFAAGAGCATGSARCYALGSGCLPYGGPGLPAAGGCPPDRPYVERGACVAACTVSGAVPDDYTGVCQCNGPRYDSTYGFMRAVRNGACVDASTCPSEWVAANRPTAADHCSFLGAGSFPAVIGNVTFDFVAATDAPGPDGSDAMTVNVMGWGFGGNTPPWDSQWGGDWGGNTMMYVRASRAAGGGRVSYEFAFPTLRPDADRGSVLWLAGAALGGDAAPKRTMNPAGLAAAAHILVSELARAVAPERFAGAEQVHMCASVDACAMRACFAYAKCINDAGAAGDALGTAWAYALAAPHAGNVSFPPFGSLAPPAEPMFGAPAGAVGCIRALAESLTPACVVQPVLSPPEGHDGSVLQFVDMCYNAPCDRWYEQRTKYDIVGANYFVPGPDNMFGCEYGDAVCCKSAAPGGAVPPSHPCGPGEICVAPPIVAASMQWFGQLVQWCEPLNPYPCFMPLVAPNGTVIGPGARRCEGGACGVLPFDKNHLGYECYCNKPLYDLRCINELPPDGGWGASSPDPAMTAAEYLQNSKYEWDETCKDKHQLGTAWIPEPRYCEPYVPRQ